MVQQSHELRGLVNVGASGDQVTAGEALVERGVLPPVQLVNGQLPDGVRPGRAVAGVAVAFVGHSEVKEKSYKGWLNH